MPNDGALDCIKFNTDSWLLQTVVWSICCLLLLLPLTLVSPSVLGMIPAIGMLWFIMMINLPSLGKKKKKKNLSRFCLFIWISLTNSKQPKVFSSFCIMNIFCDLLIFLDTIFPFLPPSFVPVFSSLPPAHILWRSSGHSHFKECFPFQSTNFFIVYVYNLAHLFIIFWFVSLNFTCWAVDLMFMYNNNFKKE